VIESLPYSQGFVQNKKEALQMHPKDAGTDKGSGDALEQCPSKNADFYLRPSFHYFRRGRLCKNRNQCV
jgi:hypothetical protein